MAVDASGLDERRLRLLLEAGRALVSELDNEAVLRRLLEIARELSGARYAAIGVLDDNREELERFVTSGLDEETHRAIGDLPRGRGILGELIRNPQPLRIASISDHPRSYGFPPDHPPMTTFLGAPILIRGEVWGNIYLTEKEAGEFDELDEQSLVVLAEWAAIAIANARLYEGVASQREELERAVQGLEATTTIARALGGETDLGRILELVAKRARALVEARSLLILLVEGEELVVAAVAGEQASSTLGARVLLEGTAPGHVVASGAAERLADVGSRVRLGLGRLVDDAGTALLVPLTFKRRSLGVLVAVDRLARGPEFSAEDERLMRGFTAAAATAVATAQSVEADRLRKSIESAEHERTRWARELHDETLQGLGALRIALEGAMREKNPERALEASEQVAAGLDEEIATLQALITELRPAALTDLGLAPALESLFERTRAQHDLEVKASIDLAFGAGRHATRLTPELEGTAYRLLQEALTNVAKHADARRVEVYLTEVDGRLRIEVRDDGGGFDPAGETSGFGLVGMHERVDLLQGALAIESEPGAGTVVRADLPSRHREEPLPAPARSA